jgi:hypothetical protein
MTEATSAMASIPVSLYLLGHRLGTRIAWRDLLGGAICIYLVVNDGTRWHGAERSAMDVA